jgi:hypothetical protein
MMVVGPGVRRRMREYGYLLAGAVAGGILGAIFDQLTCAASPEYFRDGKGVAGAALPFRFAVALVGFRGGLAIGALIAGVDLLVRARHPRLARWWWLWPVAVATATAMATCVAVLVMLDPFELAVTAVAWNLTTTRRFLAVWGIHVGAYAGPLLGLAWGSLRAGRETASRR